MARKLGMTLEDVVDVAVVIADDGGLGSLTLARLADRLGVRSPSLYAHVDGIGGLRRKLQIEAARRLGAEFGTALEDVDGDDAIRELAYTYRRFAREHPGLMEALLPVPTAGEDPDVDEAMSQTTAIVARAITAAGVDESGAIDAVRSLRSAVHGFVVLENGGGFGLPHDIDHSFQVLVEMIVAGLAGPNQEECE